MKLGWIAAGILLVAATPGASAAARPAQPPAGEATFAGEAASPNARSLAAWIRASDDNRGRPYIVVDKLDAKIFLFSGEGRLAGAAPVLLGLAKGDSSVPGIGTRALSRIAAHERTTPAGRFEATLGHGLNGKDILWVDYDAAISLHRVIVGNRADRRLERLATADPLDNRISYGCINVPVAYYERVVRPAFASRGGVVYVLPDTETLTSIFSAYGLAEGLGQTRGAPRKPGP